MLILSIIIPAYNVAPYVAETLHSIECAVGRLLQGESVEVICIDDGSTDATGNILDGWVKNHVQNQISMQVRVIHQANGGVSSARNKGIELATGKWVWFVDGDDLIHSESLRIFADFNARYPDSDYLMFGYSHNSEFLVRRQDKAVHPFDPQDPESTSEVFREVCRVLFRRDLIGCQRFLDYKIGEDVAFSLTYREQHRNGCITIATLYYYRIRQGSATVCQVLSAIKTVDWIRSNRIIFEKMAAIIGNGRLVWWYPSTLWQGFNGSPHALPFRESQSFYREYVNLLYDVNRYCSFSKNRSLAIKILHVFPSSVLGWFLIYGQERLIQSLAKLRKS